MKFAIPKETHPGEKRVAMIPGDVKKLTAKGVEIHIEAGLGLTIKAPDSAYEEAGAKVASDRKALLSDADVVLRLRKPAMEELGEL